MSSLAQELVEITEQGAAAVLATVVEAEGADKQWPGKGSRSQYEPSNPGGATRFWTASRSGESIADRSFPEAPSLTPGRLTNR